MTTDIVLDTNVLIDAVDGDDEDKMGSCLHVLFRIIDENEYAIALDNQGEILDEYKRNLQGRRTPQSEYIRTQIQKHAYSSENDMFTKRFQIDDDKVDYLIENGFHDRDLVFVKISPNTNSESIVSSDGESISDSEYKEWIENELDVDICNPEGAKTVVFD
jgi:polyphosphate kinase